MNILVVDDNPMLSMALADHLASRGHNVTSAVEGRQAEQLFRQRPFDLVVTDLVMPDLDGITLLETLRQSNDRFAAIVITGFSELLDDEHARIDAVDVASVITKPFAFADIDAAIGRLAQHGAADTPAPG
jgi:DNA-binding response OmpR family regulator